MKKCIAAILVLMVSFQVQAKEKAETAEDGLKNIIALYKAKDFSTLIKTRYTEIHKTKSKEDIDKLVAMFTKRFGNEAKLNQIIGFLESAAKAKAKLIKEEKPQKTETGNVAVFKAKLGEKEIDYKLYKMKTGLWGFHL
ncbi:MAG: hypothetical protein HRT89_13075 [Lentisphaeria bacterium]|nr:hypothetical protein [Lentisphaeria bacterium]